jgi:hypothetical protein
LTNTVARCAVQFGRKFATQIVRGDRQKYETVFAAGFMLAPESNL